MKMALATPLVVMGVLLAGIAPGTAEAGFACTDADFQSWMLAHGRQAGLPEPAGADERALRKTLFCKTKRVVEEHNARYAANKTTFWMRLNQFAAHTDEEKGRLFGTRVERPTGGGATGDAGAAAVSPTRDNGPSAVDWRKTGKVSSIKNQGQCGSCWAFSAIGAIEGAVAIAEDFAWNTSDTGAGYSVDQCVACAPGTMGCEGGYPWLCFAHIIKNGGIDSERDWPYLSDTCNAAKEKLEKVATIVSYTNVTKNDEAALRNAIAVQPVSISIDAQCDAFMNYGGGVLDADCGRQIDHSVLAVGYDTGAKNPYYIVKNSWGEGWGEDGFVRMAIGGNLDCIACQPYYPQAGPKPKGPNPPEVQCKAGTFDPNDDAPSCPQGSACCCARHKFWLPKQCAERACCLGKQTCTWGKGCQGDP